MNFTQLIYEHSDRTSQETCFVSATGIKQLVQFRETISVCLENGTFYGQNSDFFSALKQAVRVELSGFKELTQVLLA
jgi:hypothetical protein